jgi:hypothetical protein
MPAEASPKPSVARLLASWFSFTRWTFSTCLSQVQDLAEGGADRVKDTIMDLGCPPAATGSTTAGPLPPLELSPFAEALREEIERTLARVVEVINEETGGGWSPRTEEQVLTLFAELGQDVLERALDLRVGAAEANLPAEDSQSGVWLHKFRRMLAEEGRWPPCGPTSSPSPPPEGCPPPAVSGAAQG